MDRSGRRTIEWWYPALAERPPTETESVTIWRRIRNSGTSSRERARILGGLLGCPLSRDVLTEVVLRPGALEELTNTLLFLEQQEAQGALRWAALKNASPGSREYWEKCESPSAPTMQEFTIAQYAGGGWGSLATGAFLSVAEELALLGGEQQEILATLLSDQGQPYGAMRVKQESFLSRLQAVQQI